MVEVEGHIKIVKKVIDAFRFREKTTAPFMMYT